MALKYEVRAKTGTYKGKDGKEKNAYSKIGVILEGEKGLSLKLETVPVNWDGWAYINEPEERQPRRASADADSDIPF